MAPVFVELIGGPLDGMLWDWVGPISATNRIFALTGHANYELDFPGVTASWMPDA